MANHPFAMYSSTYLRRTTLRRSGLPPTGNLGWAFSAAGKNRAVAVLPSSSSCHSGLRASGSQTPTPVCREHFSKLRTPSRGALPRFDTNRDTSSNRTRFRRGGGVNYWVTGGQETARRATWRGERRAHAEAWGASAESTSSGIGSNRGRLW